MCDQSGGVAAATEAVTVCPEDANDPLAVKGNDVAAEEGCNDIFAILDAVVRPTERIDDVINARDRTIGADLLAAMEDRGMLDGVKMGKWVDGRHEWASVVAMDNMTVISPTLDLRTRHSDNVIYIPAPLDLNPDFPSEVGRVAQYIDSEVAALMCVSVDPKCRALRFSLFVDTENVWGVDKSAIWKDRRMPVLNFLDFEWIEGEGWCIREDAGFRNFIIPGRMVPPARDLSVFEGSYVGEDYVDKVKYWRCWQRNGGQYHLSGEDSADLSQIDRRDWFSRQLLLCKV